MRLAIMKLQWAQDMDPRGENAVCVEDLERVLATHDINRSTNNSETEEQSE